MDNHFDLFQMPARFAIDALQLDAAYRELQGRILHSRPRSPAPSENEWNQTIRLVHRKEKRLLIRIVVYVIVVLALAAAGILWLVLAPEKSPNIFELPG